MPVDPQHPVIVGAHELAVHTGDAEPVDMMLRASRGALSETGDALRRSIAAVRVVKGIWPYNDPGRLVADRLGLGGVQTGLSRIGGNATYDLVNRTATDIAVGHIDAVIVCGAESMRTRRADKAAGKKSAYLTEPERAVPDLMSGADVELVDDADIAAQIYQPVNFYALAESAIRHRANESPAEHLQRIAVLWAEGSRVASINPHAWIRKTANVDEIATQSSRNRMVAAPYTKLMTSNINVDQGAAIVMSSYRAARDAGIADASMVFLAAGSGAHDELTIRRRAELDRSPAFRLAASQALHLAGRELHEIDHLDLYSCFPSSVQMAQAELGLDAKRSWTMTGGLTFAGGPFNGYCTQAIAHAVSCLRGTDERAFLYGNGGFFSKHSVVVLSGSPPQSPYRYQRPQAEVDALPTRPLARATPHSATIEAHTVVFGRDGAPINGILSVLGSDESRIWATVSDHAEIGELLSNDCVGRTVALANGNPPIAQIT